MRVIVIALTAAALPAAAVAEAGLAERVRMLDRNSDWAEVSSETLDFLTHHPQGMARVGNHLFVSSVEIIEPTERYDAPRDGMDRSAGVGAGHLFKMTLDGELVGRITLGEGDVYHPGGIDFDGTHLWVPVAEYRPNSASIVYRVDPETLEAEEVFRYADHLGGLLHDAENGTLHGVSWGSRRLYTFTLAEDGSVPDADAPREEVMTLNPSHYVDYQDCRLAEPSQALCTGVAVYDVNETRFNLGGLGLIDLAEGRPIHQTPIPLWTEDGLDLAHNPVWIETTPTGLRGYFMPEDDESRLFVYDVAIGD